MSTDSSPTSDPTIAPLALIRAARTGDAPRVSAILRAKPEWIRITDPNNRDACQPIHVAAANGHVDVVRLLLGAGAEPIGASHKPCPYALAKRDSHVDVVDHIYSHVLGRAERDPAWLVACDEQQDTLLHRIVAHGHAELIRILIDHGANPNVANGLGRTPIHIAVLGEGDPLLRGRIVSQLLACGAELDAWVASAIGDLHAVRECVDRDPECVNHPFTKAYYCGDAMDPLSIASQNGHLAIVRYMLDRGADPDSRRPWPVGTHGNGDEPYDESCTPLVKALEHKRWDVVKVLLDRGASVRGSMYCGPSIAELAFDSGQPDVANEITVRGGRVQLPYYVMRHDYTTIGELLDRCPDGEGWCGESITESLAGLAAWMGEPQVMRMCLANDAKIAAKKGVDFIRHTMASHNREGTWRDYVDVLRLLFEHGVDPNGGRARNASGNGTPLHWISTTLWQRTGSAEALVGFARTLLDHGADIHAVDSETHSTPLGWAARYGHRQLVEFLLSRGARGDEPKNQPENTAVAWARKVGYDELAERIENASSGT